MVIKVKGSKTKFKLRCPKHLYTLKIDDPVKADKIKSSIPSSIKKFELSDKVKKDKASKIGRGNTAK